MLHPLDALGNSARRDILRALRNGPLSVGELARRFPITRPAVSRHLKVLQDSGLVEARAEGRQSLYAVRMQGFAQVRTFLDDFWDVALDRLQELSKK